MYVHISQNYTCPNFIFYGRAEAYTIEVFWYTIEHLPSTVKPAGIRVSPQIPTVSVVYTMQAWFTYICI